MVCFSCNPLQCEPEALLRIYRYTIATAEKPLHFECTSTCDQNSYVKVWQKAMETTAMRLDDLVWLLFLAVLSVGAQLAFPAIFGLEQK